MHLKNISGQHFEPTLVKVYDVTTKEVVFEGSMTAAAKFIGTSKNNIFGALRRKYRIKNRFAVRYFHG